MAKSKTKDTSNEQVAGLDQDTYDKSASEYSKGVIFTWLVAGVIYSLIAGTFVSWSTVLLFIPGIFVISFASIPFFLLKVKKFKTITAMNERDGAMLLMTGKRSKQLKDVPTLIFFTLTSVVGFLFPIVAAIVFIRVMNGL